MDEIDRSRFHPAAEPPDPTGSSGRKDLKFAGFVPGVQSNFSSRGIISPRLLCSPQKNVPFAFRKRLFCAFRSEMTASLLL